MDQEERNRIQKEEKKEKKEDEIRVINEEYDSYTQEFLNEFVYHIKPEDEPKSPKSPKKWSHRMDDNIHIPNIHLFIYPSLR